MDHRENPSAFYPIVRTAMLRRVSPPTLLLHGTEDTDVPYAQSVIMAKALRSAGVAHDLVTMRGEGTPLIIGLRAKRWRMANAGGRWRPCIGWCSGLGNTLTYCS